MTQDASPAAGHAQAGAGAAHPGAGAPDGRSPQEAFRALVEPHLDELLSAAAHELDYRQALGELPDDLSPEELVADTLARAWRDRNRRPPLLGFRPWLLGLLLRVADALARQETKLREMVTVSLETRAPEPPIYDDDESFWEWYQPDELTRWEDVVPASAVPPEEVAAALERVRAQATRHAPPLTHRARHLLVLTSVHRLSVPEAAGALRIPLAEASQLLDDARRIVLDRQETRR
jgi:RNA polymerase sigma-70 factor (ECF subfamily)